MCGEEAVYLIKETADSYCEQCALECFSDVSFLQKVEEAAQELKKQVKERLEEDIEEKLEDNIEKED